MKTIHNTNPFEPGWELDWQDDYEEFMRENPGLDWDLDRYVEEMNYDNLGDERLNLAIQLEHPIVILADVARWNGACFGYKVIESGNISDILYSLVRGASNSHWYSDGANICCDEAHHDGTNHYVYRELLAPIEDIKDGLFDDRKRERTIQKYTRSIAPNVHKVYGWGEEVSA